MAFVKLCDVTPTRVQWLWPGRLPSGHLAMIDGDPGLGKSFVTLDLCARISAGEPFPDGSPTAGPAAVVILSGEDGLRDVVYSRLRAAGANFGNIYAYQRQPGEAPLRIPSDCKRLEQIVRQTKARYVVIDPISAFFDSSVIVTLEPSVRAALEPLAEIADHHDCVIQLVRHLNKTGGSNPLYRGLHTIGFTAMCRVTWLIGADPRVSGQFVLAQPKSNLDPPQPSLTYAIEATELGAAHVVWRGTSTAGAIDLLAGAGLQTWNRLRAQEFLRVYLKAGPRKGRDLRAAAKAHRISNHQLQQAREELKIRITFVNVGKPDYASYWVMPGQAFTTEVSDTPDLDEWIRQWDEQYAGPMDCPHRLEPEAGDDAKDHPDDEPCDDDGEELDVAA